MICNDEKKMKRKKTDENHGNQWRYTNKLIKCLGKKSVQCTGTLSTHTHLILDNMFFEQRAQKKIGQQ